MEIVIDTSAIIAVIRRIYKIIPIREKESPLDVETVDLGVSTDEIVEIVREFREKGIKLQDSNEK